MCLTCLKRGLSGILAVFPWKPEFRSVFQDRFHSPHVRFGSGMNCTRMWYLYVLTFTFLDFERQKMLTRFSLTALAWVSVELAGWCWFHIKGKSMGYTTIQLSIRPNDGRMVCQTVWRSDGRTDLTKLVFWLAVKLNEGLENQNWCRCKGERWNLMKFMFVRPSDRSDGRMVRPSDRIY